MLFCVERLVSDIERSRKRLVDRVECLGSRAVLPAVGGGRWSAGQYVEHLALAEEVTLWRMWTAVKDSRCGHDPIVCETPDLSIEEVVDRTWRPKEKAPPLARPRLEGSIEYWLSRLRRNRQILFAFCAELSAEDLDRVAYPHPISGPLTVRQGLQFIRFHLDRHAEHIQGIEVTERRAVSDV